MKLSLRRSRRVATLGTPHRAPTAGRASTLPTARRRPSSASKPPGRDENQGHVSKHRRHVSKHQVQVSKHQGHVSKPNPSRVTKFETKFPAHAGHRVRRRLGSVLVTG